MQPVQVEVISPLPEGWGFCLSCEVLLASANLDKAPDERGLDEYPIEWQEDFHHLSTLIFSLATQYGESIVVRIFDPRSLQGFFKSIRYGVRRYPTFIIDRRLKSVGWDTTKLEQMLQSAGAHKQTRSL